jgi:uncharacterized protein (TIGR03083 family)
VVDVWERVAHYRCEVADRLEALDGAAVDEASWCEGWRVRDVAGHLVHLAEASQLSMLRDLASNGLAPERAVSTVARRFGELPVPELARRLRQAAGGRYHVPGSPRAVALGELLVHGEDALRPVGHSLDAAPQDVAPVLDVYRRISRFVFHQRVPKDLRLVASDTEWTSGTGPELRGRAIDLLLLLANRRQVVAHLEGPGLAGLG